ncbi:MAG TPA: prolyl oligopeptidase family serine peptidase [Candidatus Baltobacteraceae bacterium]|nr:prolyl oligopeptidase family serine peptidase [Candidatus Baltobacteraceae bacterium]
MAEVRTLLRHAVPMIAAVALLGAARAPAPLALSDLRTIVRYSDPQLSPDGRYVAAVETRNDYTANHPKPELVVIDVATHAKRALTVDRAMVSAPRWSPSGDRLAFVSLDEKKKAQVYVLPMNGGEARPATAAENGITIYAWSPHGKRIAYVTLDTAPNKKAIEAHDDGFVITEQPFTARSAVIPAHIWIVGDDPKKAKRLTHGTWGVAPTSKLVWRPDGRAIAFTWNPDGSFNFYGRTRAAYAVVPSGAVRFFAGPGTMDPVYDRAGARVAYLGPNRIAQLQNDVIVAAADGAHPVDVGARLDRSADPPAFDASGAVVISAGDGTRGRGYVLRGGSFKPLPFGDVDANYVEFSTARNGSLAFAGVTEHDPSEVYVLAPHASRLTALTNSNAAFARHPMGTRRTIAWTSPDGIPLDAVVTEPVGFDRAKRYPMVLYIHGGPTGASSVGFDFLGVPELMAARGWLVLEPNYRGSNSLGARGIATSIKHPASIAGRDILESVALVEKRYHVDTTRIGVSGWSAGGWMTSWMITHDTRWRAAFDGAAVDSLENVATIGDIDSYANILIGGDPWNDAAAMRTTIEQSPQTYWANVKTRTLIVSDAGDQRVPTPTSYEFYHSLRAAGAPVQLLIYPVNGHFPADPLHMEDVARRWVDWFAQNFRS